jgi:hypothetical protein
MKITEIENKTNPTLEPIKEVMDIYIPLIENKNIPHENGFVWLLVGAGGSGKTSLGLNMFKSKHYFKEKFHNIFYFINEASYHDIKDNPLQNIETTYHELNLSTLKDFYKQVKSIKQNNTEKKEEQEYNLVVIDDFASDLKEPDIQTALNKIIPKCRHLNTAFLFVLQSYFYFPKILRKQLTYITIFKPQNIEEWESLSKELLGLKKDDKQLLYDYVFDKVYNHLDINKKKEKIYKNFNELIIS